MKYRKLRIAWSVAWGLLCLLLIVLWVRSYWWIDYNYMRLRPMSKSHITFWSMQGACWIGVESNVVNPPIRFSRGVVSVESWLRRIGSSGHDLNELWPPLDLRTQGLLKFSYWFSASIVAATGVAPWLRMRFSLRTLLIAMTLAAVGLGLAAYTLRK
jgi:hypothetical protein